MKDLTTIREFVQKRALGWSFRRISDDLGVSKRTLISWNAIYRDEIQLRRQVELDALRSINLEAEASRIAVLREEWEKAREVLRQKNLMRLSADKVMSHFLKLTDLLQKNETREEQEMVELPPDPEKEQLRLLLFDVKEDGIL
jgi:hypothetical protein